MVYVCLLGATLLSLAIPWILRLTIDTALGSEQAGRLVLLALLVLAISLARGAFAYGQSYLSESLSQHVAYDLRHAFMARLQVLGFGFHDHQKTGDLMSRATADVESVRWFVSFGLIHSLYILVLVVGVATLMLATDRDLALVSLAAVPPAVFIAVRMSRRLRRLWMSVQVETGRMTTVLQESLAGMRVVKTFGAEGYQEHKFRDTAQVVAERTFTINRIHAANSSLLTLLFALATALVIWYGGRQIINAGLSLGELTQFLLYLGLLVFPIRMSGWVVNIFFRAISAGERIFQVLDASSSVADKDEATDPGRLSGEIKFEAVSFGYSSPIQDGHEAAPPAALEDINLAASPGQKIAILGAPGSGKSTMVSLIPRFYDVTHGRVSIDGIDVRDVTLEALRRNVGIVFQDVFLFMATIRENISYGATHATFDQIAAAARSAQIHDFIMGLPDQYDTIVGERGVTLSGGQRQRLAIARTLLLDPPVLILDDSTSSVDAETESLIQKALNELTRDRTTFVIAHRMSSVKAADLIVVLKDGRIIQRGTHDELISGDGLYSEIYRIQLVPEADLLVENQAAGDGEAQ